MTAMRTIKLTAYMQRDWAKPFHASEKRYMVLVVHRRAGKTTAALNFMQVSALKNSNRRYAYIAPTYKQAKNTAWAILKYYSKDIPGIEHRETDLTVRYPTGSTITLFGADSPDSLRGMGLAGVVFDEYSQQPSNIFSEIVRPMLVDHNGYAIWIGTPKGKNEFYRLYEHALNDPDRLALKLTVDDTKVIDAQEIEDARKSMSEDEFKQEWYCSFNASLKGSVYGTELAQLRSARRIKQVPHDTGEKVYTVWDLGVGAAMAVGFFQRIGSEMRMIDYWQGAANESLPEAIRAVNAKPYDYGKHFAPHDVTVREISSGMPRVEIARNLGITFDITPSMLVASGIEKAKILFSRLWVDETNCRLWLDAIAQYCRGWDDTHGMFKDTPRHDWTSHAADVLRYAAIVESEMRLTTYTPYVQPPYEPPGYGDRPNDRGTSGTPDQLTGEFRPHRRE